MGTDHRVAIFVLLAWFVRDEQSDGQNPSALKSQLAKLQINSGLRRMPLE
jgi:hypothetical protein